LPAVSMMTRATDRPKSRRTFSPACLTIAVRILLALRSSSRGEAVTQANGARPGQSMTYFSDWRMYSPRNLQPTPRTLGMP
jgi:hypothetical protein